MKDLKCGKKECRFNKGYCCTAKDISITNDTYCSSYDPVEEKRKSLFEVAHEFAKANYTVDTHVKCTADCIFEHEKCCTANGITVMSEDERTPQCLTYVKK
ncbi:MAG: DUF1540 domain-containing protein [Firmicutes bacterium]|nr:DUF1540 domain-containing protein [Bacillota bacterium]